MLILAEKANDFEQGKEMILENIRNGKAYQKLVELVQNQGGDISYLEDTDKFEKAKYIVPIVAKEDGTLTRLDAFTIGKMSGYLGAGRMKKEDNINPRVGFVFKKKVGDKVKIGDVIGYIHSDDEVKANEIKENQDIYKIG